MTAVIDRAGLDALIGALRRRGFTVIGPRVRSEAIVYDEIASADELPAGVEDVQDGGTYRLRDRGTTARCSPTPSATTPSSASCSRRCVPVWRARRAQDGTLDVEPPPPPPRYAFLGVRSCDLHAVAIQDRVFLGDRYVDPDYEARREDAFFVAVNCARAGGTCFCVSMDTGPAVTAGHDLALTELIDDDGHRFLVEAGSERGRERARRAARAARRAGRAAPAPASRPTAPPRRWAAASTRTASATCSSANAEHPRWDDVAERCLSCGNCTMVCPTCFCSTAEDTTDLDGRARPSTRGCGTRASRSSTPTCTAAACAARRASRYRQWLTHKLGTWIDQFGSSGCVGCGRCITWCPVAIDITEEVAAIRAGDLREGLDADG